MNDKIDVSLNGLNQPGNIWINEKSKQLRYKIASDEPSNWVVPLSVYEVGNNVKDNNEVILPNEAYIKRGQPVSVGLFEDLDAIVQSSADPAVVPTNPRKYQWCIGIALEPGNAVVNPTFPNILNHIHILSRGQIEYDLNDTRENIFHPPYITDTSGNKVRYVWNYEDDIGKPVYVSNHPDDNFGKPGGLTIDITHAYYNGANIISVGRLADAPRKADLLDQQQIVIEVQPAGDVRGMIDSTQFDVRIAPSDPNNRLIKYENQNADRLIFVKIEELNNRPIGIVITSDEILLRNSAQRSPIGAFLAKPNENDEIDLEEYCDTNVLCHRLGILEGEQIKDASGNIIRGGFQFNVEDFGKELYLANGAITHEGAADSFEYKVGIILDYNRVLVDCRYPRMFKKFDAIGTIKPAYTDRETDRIIVEPGFIEININEIHKVSGGAINFEQLLRTTMHTGMYLYSPDGNPTGPWVDIDGNFTFDSGPNSIIGGYFKFKDVFYSAQNGVVSSQINYNQEGAPDDMQYVWPQMSFNFIYDPQIEGLNPMDYVSTNIRFNIDYLVNLGAHIDGQGRNIENYDIVAKVPRQGPVGIHNVDMGVYLSPGFYTNGQGLWCGFEWVINFDPVLGSWYLRMATKPGGPSDIPNSQCLGLCWPHGRRPDRQLLIQIFIRRRPVQYHSLFLNQLVEHFPWKPHTDGQNLVTEDTLFFGEMHSGITGINDETSWILNMSGASQIQIKQDSPISGRYRKQHNVIYGPHWDPDLTGAQTVNFVTEKRIVTNWASGVLNQRSIDWQYDFDNQIVGLLAEFAPKLVAPSTADENITEFNSWTNETIDYHYGNYIEGRTQENPSGLYLTPRSALKTLHEVPVGFFNYTSDLNKNNRRITTLARDWMTSGDLTDPRNVSLEKWLPNDFIRHIFPPQEIEVDNGDGTTSINYIPISGTSYQYASINASNIRHRGEWEHIVQEINMMFSNVVRDSYGNTTGGEYQVFQTNIGLLNYAAKETQDRLLRIERALFGSDYETMPKGIHGLQIQSQLDKYEKLNACLDEGGILRQMGAMRRFNVINNITRDITSAEAYHSNFIDINNELFGNYVTEQDWLNLINSNGGTSNGNFHRVYIWWLAKQGGFNAEGISNHYIQTSLPAPDTRVQSANDSAKNIYIQKSHSFFNRDTGTREGGYQFEVPFNDGNVFTTRGRPFAWPISHIKENRNTNYFNFRKDLWLGSNTYNRWWHSDMMGDNDRVIIEDPNIPGVMIYQSSFASQSVEGILYDIISKLSYIRENCDIDTHSINADLTVIDKYKQYDRSSTGFYTFRPNYPFDKNDINNRLILKNSSESFSHLEANIKYNGEYSAFGFEKHKISSGWTLKIRPIHKPENFTNKDYQYKPKFTYILNRQNISSVVDYWRPKDPSLFNVEHFSGVKWTAHFYMTEQESREEVMGFTEQQLNELHRMNISAGVDSRLTSGVHSVTMMTYMDNPWGWGGEYRTNSEGVSEWWPADGSPDVGDEYRTFNLVKTDMHGNNFMKYRFNSSGTHDFNYSGIWQGQREGEDINTKIHSNLSGINNIGPISGLRLYRNYFDLGEQIIRADLTSGIELKHDQYIRPIEDEWISGTIRRTQALNISGRVNGTLSGFMTTVNGHNDVSVHGRATVLIPEYPNIVKIFDVTNTFIPLELDIIQTNPGSPFIPGDPDVDPPIPDIPEVPPTYIAQLKQQPAWTPGNIILQHHNSNRNISFGENISIPNPITFNGGTSNSSVSATVNTGFANDSSNSNSVTITYRAFITFPEWIENSPTGSDGNILIGDIIGIDFTREPTEYEVNIDNVRVNVPSLSGNQNTIGIGPGNVTTTISENSGALVPIRNIQGQIIDHQPLFGFYDSLAYQYTETDINLDYGNQAIMEIYQDSNHFSGASGTEANNLWRNNGGPGIILSNEAIRNKKYGDYSGLFTHFGTATFNGYNQAAAMGTGALSPGFTYFDNVFISGIVNGRIAERGIISGELTSIERWSATWGASSGTSGNRWGNLSNRYIFGYVNGFVSGLVVDGFIQTSDLGIRGIISNVNTKSDIIIHRPTIDRFALYGSHIPTDYDMMTKIHGEKDVSNQLHLALNEEPFDHPKEITSYPRQTIVAEKYDDIYLLWWRPLNITNKYLIYMADSGIGKISVIRVVDTNVLITRNSNIEENSIYIIPYLSENFINEFDMTEDAAKIQEFLVANALYIGRPQIRIMEDGDNNPISLVSVFDNFDIVTRYFPEFLPI